MSHETLLKAGIVGTIVAALCCFTPVLVWTLAAVGLAAAVGWVDMIALPALAVFAALTVFALWKRRTT